jgi:hypothetical protein
VAAFAKMEDSSGTQLTASNTILAFMRWVRLQVEVEMKMKEGRKEVDIVWSRYI